MGAKQTKAAGQEAGASPQSTGWRRTPTKERGDILASLMLRSRNTLRNSGTPPPYQRRILMIQEMMLMAQQGKHDEATEMLKTLRQVQISVYVIGNKHEVVLLLNVNLGQLFLYISMLLLLLLPVAQSS